MAVEETGVRPSIEDRDALWSRGLFVAGHARSGTSILQIALNSSPDIYILGEANLHDNVEKPRFAQWYRAMHEEFRNPPSKSTSCPTPIDPEGNGWDTILNLSRRHRFIGDKFAFRSRKFGYNFDKNRMFLQDYFGGSTVLCTLRHPQDVIFSNNRMFKPSNLDEYLHSYIECIIYQIDLFFCIENVYFFSLHQMSSDTFEQLSDRLQCKLPHSFEYYRDEFQNRGHPGLEEADRRLMDLAEHAFQHVSSFFTDSSFECGDRLQMMRLGRSLRSQLRELTPGESA